MTKQEIIDCITKNKSCSYVATGADLKPIESTRLYQFGVVEIKATADELLELIEQEKKKQAREILEEVFAPYNDIGGGLYELTPKDKRTLAKKYGVEL